MKHFILPITLIILCIGSLKSQHQCGTDILHEKLMATDSVYRNSILKMESQIRNILENKEFQNLRNDEIYTIPVVVHVIHLGEPVGSGTNISDQQIYDAIQGLNNTWKNIYEESVDMGFEFCLASRNPNNKITTGIVRVNGTGINKYSSQGISFDGTCGASQTEIKDLSKWPVKDYYNIWVVNKVCGAAAYAYLPNGNPYDGTVISYDHMDLNYAYTLPHEVGHGFNLYHTHQGPNNNCPPNVNCLQDGDKVCDTPPHRISDCGTTNPCTSSGNWDNSKRNFMSYCGIGRRFTQGQKDRTRAAAVASIRKPLLSSLGCLPVLRNDIAIVNILEPALKTIYIDNCPGNDSINLKVRFQNVGLDTITSINFNIYLNDNLISSLRWNGSASNNEIINFELSKIKIDTGLFNLKITADSVNNKQDDYPINNILEHEFTCKRINSIKLENEIKNVSCNGLTDGKILLKAAKHISISENFETIHDWTIINEDNNNFWIVGDKPGDNANNSIYITDDSINYVYNPLIRSEPYFYKQFFIPLNSYNVNLKFDIKVKGIANSNNFGGILVYAIPDSIQNISDDYRITFLNNIESFTTFNFNISNLNKGLNYKIIFRWLNWGTMGNQPPAAIDNIELSYDLPEAGPYSFEWSGPINSMNQNLINAPNGTYNVIVTDTLGCTREESFIINSPPALNIASEVMDNLCHGNADGSIQVTPINGISLYSFNWSNGGLNNYISNLVSDNYNLTITDHKDYLNQFPLDATCIPLTTNYCCGIGIYNVKLNNINKSSLPANEGYKNYTNEKAIIEYGQTNLLEVTTGPSYPERVVAWIDFNNDGIFTQNEQILYSQNSSLDEIHKTNIIIPESAVRYTPLRLRIMSDNGIFPMNCTNLVRGQCEDYTVFVGRPACSIYSFEISEPPVLESTIYPSGLTSFCEGNSLYLTANEADSYQWSNNSTSRSIIVTESGIFWVTVTDSNGCSAVSDSIIVTVNPLPIANITPSDTTTFCDGNSVTLLVNEASSYLWSNNSDNRNIIVTQSGNYSVTITDSNGCSAVSDSIIVTVNPLPFVIITPSDTTTFCDGNSVTLSANEASSYLWSNNSGNINITVTQSGNYSLTITDANGCTGESEIISVTVDTLPQPIITPDGNTSFCEGGSVQLHGGNFQTYIWSTGETSQNITVSTTGDYTVTVTDSNGCTGISPPITVNVNDILFVEIIYDGDNNICPDESIILQSSVTGIEYSWNTNESTASIIVSEAGTYQLSVTNANGCTGISDQVTINEFTVSDIEIDTIGMTTFCAGDSVILTSSSSATYHWSNGSSSQETTIYNAGNYNVTVTDANGCRNTSDNVTISVLSLPEPVITPNSNVAFCEGGSVILQTSSFEKYKWSSGETTSAIVVDHSGTFVVTVEDSNGCSGISEPISVIEYENPIVEIQSLSGNTICDGDSTTLISSIEGISYSWNTNETTDKIVISTSGSYQLTITDQNGCEGASEPFEVTVLPLPMIQIDTIGNTAFCSGDSVILRCNEAVAYLWNNGHTTREFKAFTTGSFQVTITGENNCKNNSEIIQVTSYSNPVPQLNLTGNISLCTGDSISLFTEEGYVYLWNTGDNSQLINISEEGSYWVNVIDQNGCTGISDVVSLSLDTLPDVEILLIGNDTICQGEMVTLKAINAVSYVWNSGQIGSEILITVSGQYRVEGTNSQGCSQVESIWIIVKENLEPMVTISSPQNSVCEGDLVVFTSSVTNEGINPSYQWFVNGVDQLVNLPEFSTNTLENGASVFCRMTSDEQCLTKPFDNSNSISVAVNDIVDPKIEIISVPEILYECLEYEFNADLTNQGSIPEVKWFINGILISDSLSFVYADFKAGDKLYCSLASSLPCVSNALVYSDTISLNISPLPLPVIIFSNDSISSTNYQSSDYSYNWYVNGQLVSNQQIISCQEYGNGNYYLEISVNGCTVTSQILNVANCTVSSEDILKYDQIVVFPNPTTGILNILSRNNSYPVNIIGLYDGIGRKIAYNQIEKENIIQLDLSSFSTGVYFIKIANQSVIKEVKIIKF